MIGFQYRAVPGSFVSDEWRRHDGDTELSKSLARFLRTQCGVNRRTTMEHVVAYLQNLDDTATEERIWDVVNQTSGRFAVEFTGGQCYVIATRRSVCWYSTGWC